MQQVIWRLVRAGAGLDRVAAYVAHLGVVLPLAKRYRNQPSQQISESVGVALLMFGDMKIQQTVGTLCFDFVGPKLAHLVRETLAPNKPVRIVGQADDRAECNCHAPAIDMVQAQGLSAIVPLQKALLRSVRQEVGYGH